MPFCLKHKWNDILWSGKPPGGCRLKHYLSGDEEDLRKYFAQHPGDSRQGKKRKVPIPNCPHQADYPNELCERCSNLLERCERCGARLLPGEPRNPSVPPLPEEGS